MKALLRSITFIAVAVCTTSERASAASMVGPTAEIADAGGMLTKICLPFVVDGLDPQEHIEWFANHGSKEPLLEQQGLSRIQSGPLGAVYLGRNRQGARDCEIVVRRADPMAARAAALVALAARGERFAPERSRYLPGNFAAEDMMCAAADSKHLGAFVMLSAAHPEDSGRVSILVSVTDQVRQAGCDQPGVPLNFRMLAPGG